MKRCIVGMALLLLASVVCSGCWLDRVGRNDRPFDVQEIGGLQAARTEIRLVTLDFPPMEYEEQGVAKGFAVELVREAFRRSGHGNVRIEVYPWARALKMVQSGEADAIFTAYRTPEREAFLLYSKEVLLEQVISLYARDDRAIAFDGRMADLARYRIGVQENISLGGVFDRARAAGGLQIDAAHTSRATIEKLIDGRIDLVASNRYTAQSVLRNLAGGAAIRELQPPIERLPSYIAFSRKRSLESLRNDVDAALVQMKMDGSYERIVHSGLYEK